jgi:hypothetical protein
VGEVRAEVAHDPADFQFLGGGPGADAPPGAVFVQSNAGAPTVLLVQNASQGTTWAPGEYELARLRYQLVGSSSKPLYYVNLQTADVEANGASKAFRTLNAVVFIGT